VIFGDFRCWPCRLPQAWLQASSNNLPAGSAGRVTCLSTGILRPHTHTHTHPLYMGVGTYFLDSTMSNLRSIRNSDAAPHLDRNQQMLLPKTNLHPSYSSKQYVCYACSRSFQRRGGFVRHHCESAVPQMIFSVQYIRPQRPCRQKKTYAEQATREKLLETLTQSVSLYEFSSATSPGKRRNTSDKDPKFRNRGSNSIEEVIPSRFPFLTKPWAAIMVIS
jgi:hypothetical protein